METTRFFSRNNNNFSSLETPVNVSWTQTRPGDRSCPSTPLGCRRNRATPYHRRVDAPEIRRHLHVAIVQIREARVPAVEAAPNSLADDEHRRRGAVVCAEAAVLFDPA